MTKTKGPVPPVQETVPVSRTVRLHLLQLADGAYAKAERSRRNWYRATISSEQERFLSEGVLL